MDIDKYNIVDSVKRVFSLESTVKQAESSQSMGSPGANAPTKSAQDAHAPAKSAQAANAPAATAAARYAAADGQEEAVMKLELSNKSLLNGFILSEVLGRPKCFRTYWRRSTR